MRAASGTSSSLLLSDIVCTQCCRPTAETKNTIAIDRKECVGRTLWGKYRRGMGRAMDRYNNKQAVIAQQGSAGAETF